MVEKRELYGRADERVRLRRQELLSSLDSLRATVKQQVGFAPRGAWGTAVIGLGLGVLAGHAVRRLLATALGRRLSNGSRDED